MRNTGCRDDVDDGAENADEVSYILRQSQVPRTAEHQKLFLESRKEQQKTVDMCNSATDIAYVSTELL